ncbi:MAG TPA: BREX-3 system P-loop-containing protein BrxF [Patescibacteria group bacterium]|nr:BREX-3 system P-loop-containing protein BrxF [Patescibacteria group bacterium]
MPITVQRVVECVHEVEKHAEHVVLIVGKPGSGKSKILRELDTMRGWKYVDSRTLLDSDFMELPPKARSAEAAAVIGRELENQGAKVILLDNIQVLFTPLLKLEPLELLKNLSRKQTIVAAWPGDYDEGRLSIARSPGEIVEYSAEGMQIIQIS